MKRGTLAHVFCLTVQFILSYSTLALINFERRVSIGQDPTDIRPEIEKSRFRMLRTVSLLQITALHYIQTIKRYRPITTARPVLHAFVVERAVLFCRKGVS